MIIQMSGFLLFGSVDVGKSTIAGQILKNYNKDIKNSYERIKKENNEQIDRQLFSNLVDINIDEQTRGKTHEYSSYEFCYKDRTIKLYDTPGHQIFIREFLKCFKFLNTCDINLGVLCLSCIHDEYVKHMEKGNTKNYVAIIRSSGLKKLIVLVNKMDMVDYKEEAFNNTVNVFNIYLSSLKTMKFEYIQYIPISGYYDDNITVNKNLKWYKHGTFLEQIYSMKNDNQKLIKKETIQTETNDVIMQIMIFDCKNIITTGFTCVGYYHDEKDCDHDEVNITFEDNLQIYDYTKKTYINKPFAKKGDIIKVRCKIRSLNSDKDDILCSITSETKFIFQLDNLTIGCGKPIIYKNK
jgi:translation elongation factor EF-1alpha